jgi:hypothetical protein
MKLVKRAEQYSIYKRGDERYAVKNANRKFVNGDEKTQILLEEGLVKKLKPAKPAVEASADAVDAETSAESA